MGYLVVFWIAQAGLGAWVGSVKGRWLDGFLLGAILGLIGVLIIALMSPTPEKRVERKLRDAAVELEVQRRRAGEEPWSSGLAEQDREQQPQS
jgi:predicted MFS family arabinose efflux permease